MKIPTHYRAVTAVGFLSGVIVGSISTWMFLSSGRPVILSILAFIPVFCFVFLTITFTLWGYGPELPLDPITVTTMDPRGPVFLPRKYGPPKSRTLKIVMYYEPGDCPAREDLINKAMEDCRKYCRFRKTPRFNFDEPLYSTFGDPELKTKEDVARHIVDWPPVRTEDELRKALQQIETLKLLENAPEWMIYRIPSYGTARACTMHKVSLCIADGLKLALGLRNDASDWARNAAKREDASSLNKKRKPVTMSFISILKMNIKTVIRSLTGRSHANTPIPLNPKRGTFKGKMVTHRMRPIPLREFRRIATLTDSTVNDVLTAVTASAIRKYCENIDPSFCNLVKLRSKGLMAFGLPCEESTQSSKQLLNNFTLVPILFPIGIMTCRKRLAKAKKTLFEIKNTVTVPVISSTYRLIMKLGFYNLLKKLVTDSVSNVSCVFSNVRGPYERASYCGKEIIHLECSYAHYTNTFLFVSYCDMMGGTFTTDMSVLENPQVLLNYIRTELSRFKDEIVPTNNRDSIQSMDRWEER